jgi:hypothetical protein
MAQAIPVSGAGTYDSPTWGESGGPFSVPPTVAAGLGSVALPSNTFNYLPQHQARWIRAIRDRMVWSSSGLFDSFILPNSGTWTTGGATLDGSCDQALVMIDASDDGGVVVEFFVAVGSPHTFTASRDTYVNLNEAGLVEYQEVANAAPAPSPTAGYVAVWKVVTDGTEIDTVTNIIPVIPVFKDVAANSLALGDYLVVGGTLEVTGDVTLDGGLAVAGLANFAGSGLVGDSGADSWSFSAATTFNATASFNADVNLGNASGDTITCTGTLSILNNCTIGSNGSDSCTINSVIIAPVVVTCASGTTPGITSTGAAASATSHGGLFSAGNDAADGMRAATTATSSNTAAALRATASGSGRAARFESDTTSPVTATIQIVPQDADASSPGSGDLYMNSARGLGKLRVYPTLGWESVHSSSKGFFSKFSAMVSGTELAAAGTELAPVTTAAPEELGDVLVTATGSLTFPNDTDLVLITLYDTTANVTVCSQNERAPDIDGGANRTRSFVIRGVYTLPSLALRTFVVTIGAGVDIDYANLIVSVEGIK